MSSRPACSTRASSKTGTKVTEKPCLGKQNKKFSVGTELGSHGNRNMTLGQSPLVTDSEKVSEPALTELDTEKVMSRGAQNRAQFET